MVEGAAVVVAEVLGHLDRGDAQLLLTALEDLESFVTEPLFIFSLEKGFLMLSGVSHQLNRADACRLKWFQSAVSHHTVCFDRKALLAFTLIALRKLSDGI